MSTTTILPTAMLRVSSVVYVLAQKILMVAGLIFVLGLIGIQAGHAGPVSYTHLDVYKRQG